ncbi:MAG: ABC transporter permease [Propionibacteriaceae bacterium]|jgi:peptide/nickel transport system permease protein|nr:ABC transporter permease [Propionibacteriaceae bacterium]
MLSYLVRRLLVAVPLLLLISFVVFGIMHLLPYDVIDSFATPDMDREALEALRERYGLNDPFLVQYGRWILGVLQGDFGYSLISRHSIADDLLTKIPNSISLVLPAYLIALVLAITLGLVAGANRGRITDTVIDTSNALFISMPPFWFALLVMYFLGFQLRLFPIIGMHSVGRTDFPDFLQHLVMPGLVLIVAFYPDMSRYVRSSTITQLNEDYVMVQRAFGASKREIFAGHISRHVLLPVITQLGLALPMLVTGALITETIFAWPGVGKYFADAINNFDYPVVMAVLLLSAALVIIGNLLADISYRLADPRVRLKGAAA